MNVLLYGPTGFVGRHLAARLLRDGHTVIHGTRDFCLIPELMDDYPKLDALINCAGEITDQHKMFESNVALVHRLLTFAKRINIPKVIHIGSSSEYGHLDSPRCEGAPTQVTDLYGATKIAATALCEGFARQYDMDVCVARPFSLYGPGDTARKLIPRLIAAAKTNETVHVTEGNHDWIYIDDFVEGLVTLLHAPREKTQGDIVNFGNEAGTSNRYVVIKLMAAGCVPNVIFTEAKQKFLWEADTSRARDRYGWTAKITLEEGLRKTIALS